MHATPAWLAWPASPASSTARSFGRFASWGWRDGPRLPRRTSGCWRSASRVCNSRIRRRWICLPWARADVPVRLGALQREHRNRLREILDATEVFRDDEVAVALELFDETFGGTQPDYEFVGSFAQTTLTG